MYLCICNAVRESDIDAAIADGVSSFREFAKRTGCSGVCGTCGEDAEALFQSRIGAHRSSRLTLGFGVLEYA
jgi:bacterioferritin-associated ferredoxin